MYMEMDFASAKKMSDKAPDDVTIEKIGSDMLDGINTTKYKILMKDKSAGGFIWLSPENIPVKMDFLSKEGKDKNRITINPAINNTWYNACMKIDARKLPREILEEKRRMAHELRKRGMTRAEIGEIVEVHADTIGRWLKLDKNNLQVNRGGRKLGEARQLTADEEKSLQKKIVDQTPDQFKLSYALWTRKSVQELIAQEINMMKNFKPQ